MEKKIEAVVNSKGLTVKDVKSTNITPLFTQIVTTCDEISLKSNLILAGTDDKKVNQIQTVIAVGDNVSKKIVPGSKVFINFKRYEYLGHKTYQQTMSSTAKESISILLPKLELADGEFLMLDDRDVHFVISE